MSDEYERTSFENKVPWFDSTLSLFRTGPLGEIKIWGRTLKFADAPKQTISRYPTRKSYVYLMEFVNLNVFPIKNRNFRLLQLLFRLLFPMFNRWEITPFFPILPLPVTFGVTSRD